MHYASIKALFIIMIIILHQYSALPPPCLMTGGATSGAPSYLYEGAPGKHRGNVWGNLTLIHFFYYKK